jgi:hypothetical protein
LDLRPGDRLGFVFNGILLGVRGVSDGLVLDRRCRARGQLTGPGGAFFNRCKAVYKPRRRRLRVVLKNGTWGAGVPVASSVSADAMPVPLAVLIDRAPYDGATDKIMQVAVPLRVSVKQKKQGSVIEAGKSLKIKR